MEKINKVQIITKASNNTINAKNIKDKITLPLKGNQIDGVYSEVFDKIYQRAMLEELYDELIDKGVIEESKESWKRVCKNIDPVIYNTLKQYDKSEKSKESKSLKYAQIMLKQIDRQMNESKRQYKKRVNLVRRVDLEDNGIELNYDFRNMKILGKGLWNKVKIIRNSIKNRELSKIKILNIQDDQVQPTEQKASNTINGKELAKTIQEFNIPSRKEEKRYKAKKGLLETLKEKANNVEFRKKVGKKLVNAGVLTAMALGAVTIFNTSKAKVANLLNNNQTEVNNRSITENVESKKIDTIITEKTAIEEANIDLKEFLEDSVNLYIGKQTSFRIDEAEYWESPDGKGKRGNINQESELYITDIDVVDEQGLSHYNVADGLSINEIKAKHPNGKLAYHVNRIDEQDRILGWINDAHTIDKINSQITKSRLNTLVNYLTPEAKEIFYNTIKSSNEGVTKSNKDIITTLIREAEQAEKAQNQEPRLEQNYVKKSEQEIGDR